MSETRVVSAATDSCSGACSSGAHVQPARQGDAIGGREHDDDRRSRRGRHAQLDRAGGRRRRRAGRAAAPAAPKHIPLVGEQHHSARRDVGRRAHRLLGHLETSVDARTACSGTSSTRLAARLVLEGRNLCGRVELRVGLERGVAVAGRGAMLAAYRPMRARRRDAHAARETSVARRDGVSERAAGRVRRRVLG